MHKTWIKSAKTWKLGGPFQGHHTKLKKVKMEYEEEEGGFHMKMRPKFHGHITTNTHIYKKPFMFNKITKMPI